MKERQQIDKVMEVLCGIALLVHTHTLLAGYSIKYLLRFEMKKNILFHNIIYFTSHNIYNIIIFYIHKLFIPKTQPR